MKLNNIKSAVMLLDMAVVDRKTINYSIVNHLQLSPNQQIVVNVIIDNMVVAGQDVRWYLSKVLQTLKFWDDNNQTFDVFDTSIKLSLYKIKKGTEL